MSFITTRTSEPVYGWHTGSQKPISPEPVDKIVSICFRQDPRLTSTETAILADYDEPIYDRGHLANDADLKDDLTEQINTYVLSNMSPQHCRF